MAMNENRLVLACSKTSWCCAFKIPDRQWTNSSECCGEPDRVFDAGPAVYANGPHLTTHAFDAGVIIGSKTASPSTATGRSTVTIVTTPTANSGLTSGAKGGIGAAVAIVVVGLLCGLFFGYVRLKKRSKRRSAVQMPESDSGDYLWNMNAPVEMSSRPRPQEKDGTPLAELSRSPVGREQPPQELDAS
jgi:hypothetical protein